ncbi:MULTISPECIES: PLP-dependent aminotransferase family protein [unclassified Mycobacterium]|uniref:MocR-like pyridoxine biosynthesis transcription factor PdxR n=1 Tax=unclassified Mycobacterium TaxID=2642494 RepID=UPI0029C7688D|nr:MULTISPECIES: PLP-dependent aminotransferase family protein [unclassified Mycobacterium]
MAVSGTTKGPEVLVEIDRSRPEPLHRQLTDGLRAAIRAGRLLPQARMPSSRVLAVDLGVSRRLVVDAYAQLVAEGFLVSQHGSGTRVASVYLTEETTAADVKTSASYAVDFTPGCPDLANFPRNAWLRALRQGLATTPSDVFGYVAPQGQAAFREALSGYLRRTRGVLAEPDQIVVCGGVTQGISLSAQVLRKLGKLPVAIEDPAFWFHRIALRHSGVDAIPIPVDEEGINVDALAATDARAVLITPAHQSPTGVVMSPPRRAAILEWAQAGNYLIEDDYDAEYRYDRAPVGAMQALAPDRVIYLGTTSKVLAPALRLGWMVLPAELVSMVTKYKMSADLGTSIMDQIAFGQLLASGDYDRHLRQMRRRYISRRNAMLRGLERWFPDATVMGAAAGVQLAVHFPAGYPIDDLVHRAFELGVKVEALQPWYADRRSGPPGLILGFADVSESQILHGIEILGKAANGLD